MKEFQQYQRISAGVSLVLLALGFSVIGIMSLVHPMLSDDPTASSATGCVIGGWASIGTATVFLFAAFVYWRWNAWLAAYPGVRESRHGRAEITGSDQASCAAIPGSATRFAS